METMKEAPLKLFSSKQMDGSLGTQAWLRDPRGGLKRYLLLKYLQVLVLPVGNELLLTLGALASLYTVVLLCSPRVSRKASTVLLGQLAWADSLVPLRWGLGALVWATEEGGTLGTVAQGLLRANQHTSLLFLSCLSLEALLVTRRPVESRGLRTVRSARLASAVIWTAVLTELLVLQAADHCLLLAVWVPILGPVLQGCLLAAPLLCIFSNCLKGALWLANAWVYYMLFYNAPQRRKSCFH